MGWLEQFLPPALAGAAGFLLGGAATGLFGAKGSVAKLLAPRSRGWLRRALELSDDRRAALARKLEAAGDRERTPEDVRRDAFRSAVVVGVLGALVPSALGDTLGLPPALLVPAGGALGALLGFQYPELRLDDAEVRRAKAASRDAADFVEMLAVLNEAGLGLVHAVDRLAQEWPGPLGDEFRRAATEGRGGRWAAVESSRTFLVWAQGGRVGWNGAEIAQEAAVIVRQ